MANVNYTENVYQLTNWNIFKVMNFLILFIILE